MKYCLLVLLLFCSMKLSAYEPFDLRKDFRKVSSIDLVVFKGFTQYEEIGGRVKTDTFVVGQTRSKIVKTFKNYKWDAKTFIQLIAKHKPKLAVEGDCLCRPKYVCAFVFYVDVEDGPFSDPGNPGKEMVAIAMFDEGHNSVMISDQKHGIKHYRVDTTSKKDSAVPTFISLVFKNIGMEYKFMDSGKSLIPNL